VVWARLTVSVDDFESVELDEEEGRLPQAVDAFERTSDLLDPLVS
jgi:hypothetical protein